jgi:arylsulfatase A-like enzyme/Tfp pilus assembly protein PilF
MSLRSRRFWLLTFLSLAILSALLYRTLSSKPANVLIITLDTTRADRIGCYGYKNALTPAIDSVAREGVLFERAYAPAPLTLPSHASLFTGLYSPEHGVRTNGRGKFAAPNLMLSEVLSAASYQTGAFVASFVLDARFGLDRGFQTYDDDIRDTSHPDDVHHRERSGEVVVDSALRWLKKTRSEPFLCWVHLYDPHFPYQDHAAEFGDQFSERPYDAEIAFVDQQIDRLLAHLKESGLDSNTMIVIVGDHGEGLGDHIEENHGYTLYNSTQHVPLIIRHPGVSKAGHRHSQPVSVVDVFPTICELLSYKPPEKISGRSLVDAIYGNPFAPINCYSATDDPFLMEGWSPQRSLTTERWKYIRTTRPELFDLSVDPNETQNLADSNPQQLQQMELALSEMEGKMLLQESENIQLSEQERRTLQSLGYLGHSDSRPGDSAVGQSLIDVKDMLQHDVDARVGYNLMQAGKIDEAVESLRPVVERSPGHAASRLFLGQALELKGDVTGAMAAYEQALAIKPDHLDALVRLGAAYGSQGQFEKAIQYFDEALKANPESVSARLNLGRALFYMKKFSEASDNLEFALKMDPELPGVRLLLSESLRFCDRGEEAIPHLTEELRRNPRSVPARMNLAAVWAATEPRKALELLDEAQRLNPGNPHIFFQIGQVLIAQKRPVEAIEYFNRTQQIMPDHPEVASAIESAKKQLNQQP